MTQRHSEKVNPDSDPDVENNTFIIGGSPRSGTTLLNQILCACPEAPGNVTVSEAKFLEHYLHAYRMGKASYASDHEAFFGEMPEFAKLNQNILLMVLHAAFTHLDARCLVLKWPFVTPYIPELVELLPSVRILLMVRDPRDIVASLIKVGQRMEAAGKENPFCRSKLEETIRYFHDCYQPVYPLLESPQKKANILVVKYENLVLNTTDELHKLHEFSRLDLMGEYQNPADLQFDKSLWETHKKEWLTELSGQSISAASIGSWHDTLTPDEIVTVENLTQVFFSTFEYQTSD